MNTNSINIKKTHIKILKHFEFLNKLSHIEIFIKNILKNKKNIYNNFNEYKKYIHTNNIVLNDLE